MTGRSFRALFLGVLLVAGSASTACDPGRALIIENRSPETVVLVFVADGSGERERDIPPNGERRVGVLDGQSVGRFRLLWASGEMLFEGDLTWTELEQIDFRLVINSSGVQLPAPRAP